MENTDKILKVLDDYDNDLSMGHQTYNAAHKAKNRARKRCVRALRAIIEEESGRVSVDITDEEIKKVAGWYMDYVRVASDPAAPWSRKDDFKDGIKWTIKRIKDGKDRNGSGVA